MLLETQGRYSYVVSWIFIILAVCGLESFSSDNEYFTKAINIYQKYKTQMNYIIFGIVTTISNIITYYILYNKLHIENVTATVIAWFVSVIVAYVTNKIWVFESKSLKPAILVKEVSSFFACRILTGFLDVGIMWIGVDLLLFNSTLLKIISNVIVIVLNYVASKLFIFKNKNESDS
ncbi:MAG: GtrA family protein [Clostridia bacterium]|nr:GtrA family protein [Clostridia bacterium]